MGKNSTHISEDPGPYYFPHQTIVCKLTTRGIKIAQLQAKTIKPLLADRGTSPEFQAAATPDHAISIPAAISIPS